MSARRQEQPIPAQIGKYTIINEVGRGSTSNVYLSHDPQYGRDVAIKVYNYQADDDDDKDGLSNRQEYAFGLDPTSGSSVSPVAAPSGLRGRGLGGVFITSPVFGHVAGLDYLGPFGAPARLLGVHAPPSVAGRLDAHDTGDSAHFQLSIVEDQVRIELGELLYRGRLLQRKHGHPMCHRFESTGRCSTDKLAGRIGGEQFRLRLLKL